MNVLTAVRLSGDPFSIGRQHGEAHGPAIRAFLQDDLCRLNRIIERPTSIDELTPIITAYSAAIDADLPSYGEEIRGLAEGSGLTPHEAMLLQIRREIMGYTKVPSRGDCTTYARTGGPKPVVAQTIDLNGDLDDQIRILDVTPASSGRRVLLLTFTGLLGYLGINSDALAIGLNLVLGGDWKPGIPPYLAIRYLLDNAGSVDDCIDRLSRIRLASSRSFTLCDPHKAATVELLDGKMRVAMSSETVHTNHFLDPDLAKRDEVNVFAKNSSIRRLQACRSRLAATAADCGVEDHFAILSQEPIHVRDQGDIRRERTVATVVMQPKLGLLHVRAGDPSLNPTQTFSI